MSDREIACWAIRYTADPFQQEPRNIGLIAHDRGETHCVMMGDAGRIPDARFFCLALGFPEAAGWVYSEWVRWFKGLAEDAKTPHAIQDELDRLAKAGAKFTGGDYFGAMAPSEEDVHAVARRLFSEMVKVPNPPKRSAFDTDFEDAINASGIEGLTTLRRDVELEIQDPVRSIFVRLPVFVEAPVRLGIKLMRFEGTSDTITASQANDILYSYDALTAHGILDRKRCVVLHDRPTPRRFRYLDRIGAHARLLMLGEPGTPRALNELGRVA